MYMNYNQKAYLEKIYVTYGTNEYMQHNAKTEEEVHLLKYICHPRNISHIDLIIKMPRITL